MVLKKIDFDLLDDDPESRFSVECQIGEGTFGEVHKAFDSKSGKHVAIKIFDCIEENVDEIQEEFAVLSTHWIHPNIPNFVGIFLSKGPSRSEDQVWLALELCSGGSVTDLLESMRKKSQSQSLIEEEIAYILSEVTNALVYLHGHCRIHRDIKGNNILLTEEGDVKLIDYGISCEVDNVLAKRHTSVGTPYWMAPEVIMCDEKQCHEYDARCDVWSLGITAIELADGSPPLSDIHPMRALFQIPRNPPPTLKDETRWTVEFAEFIAECLIKNYEERPMASEVAEHPFLQNVPHNPTYIKRSLVRRIEDGANIRSKCEATIRGGRLKVDRKVKSEPIDKDDLAALEVLSETIIVETLGRRYMNDKIYTYIGDILVAINPYKDLPIYSARIMSQYRNASQHDRPAHIFAMANKAYHSMIHEAKNQRFVISGESGAGKTVTANLVTKMLVYLGRAPLRNIEDKILQIHPILEAFGNARTDFNDNSSRFAKYLDLSFSKVGKVTGARVSVFLLEHTRLLRAESGLNQNFHIFSLVYNGLKNQGKLEDFGLENSQDKFNGLTLQEIVRHEEEFGKLVSAFKLIGFRDSEMDTIYRILSAILNLLRIEFKATLTENNTDGSIIINKKGGEGPVQVVARLLGVQVEDLIESLTTCRVSARGDVITKSNSANESRQSVNALAMGLYSRLFDYIVSCINKLLSFSRLVYGESSTIGILDIFGFECLSGKNSFEQLCINAANEQLHFYFNQFIFCWEREEYILEGIPVSLDEVQSNREVLETLLARPLGLFSILDEESKFPSANDSTFTAKLDTHLKEKSNGIYSRSTTDPKQFIIRHFAGEVCYDSENFIDKNRNFLSPDLIATMRDSTDEIVRLIFCIPFGSNGRLMQQQESSTTSSSSNKSDNQQYSQSRSQQTVSTYFRYSLMNLLRTTLDGTPHFVRCIKPNVLQKPDKLSVDQLVRQLRYSGLLETVRARASGFTHRLTFADFLRRYCFLGFSFDERVVATKENCQLLLLRLKMDGYALGKTKVFLKYYHIDYMAKQYERQIRKIIRVQAVVRRWLAHLRCMRERWAFARNIFLMKRFVTRWKLRTKHKVAISGPKKANDDSVKKDFTEEEAAMEIQRYIRGFLIRRKIRPLLAERVEKIVANNNATEINDVRDELQDEGLTPDEAATLIQSVYRKLKLTRKIKSLKSSISQEMAEMNSNEPKLTKEEMTEAEIKLMQMVHLNNVEAMKYMRRSKSPVEVENIKHIEAKEIKRGASKSGEASPVRPSSRRPSATAVIHFYNDNGPRDEWDAPMAKFVKHQQKVMKLNRNQKTAINKLQDFSPIQSMLAETQSREFLQQVQLGVRRASNSGLWLLEQPRSCPPAAEVQEPTPLPRSVFVSKQAAPPPAKSFPHANVIEHLNAMKKETTDQENKNEDDDTSGPFDFRVLLRKTNFAPTESLRRRRSSAKRIPVLKKSSELGQDSSAVTLMRMPTMDITFTGNTIEL